MSKLYNEFAKYYDEIYSIKKYGKEVAFIEKVLKKYRISSKEILDVGCGTGNHDRLLTKQGYLITGVDLNKQMLTIAKKKVPTAQYYQGDMRSFKLKRKFEVILCMFTAINYNIKYSDLVKSLRNFKRHLSEGGLIMFDAPTPQPWKVQGYILNDHAAVLYDRREHGKVSELIVNWIFGRKTKTKTIQDSHFLRTYSVSEIISAAKSAGLKCRIHHDFSLQKRKGKRLVVICQKEK